MNLENNWRQKNLETLENKIYPSLKADEGSYLIKTCNALRKKQLLDFTTEDLRIMIGQGIGLEFLIPLAIETLTENLFAEGDMYEGDLLKTVLNVDTQFWDGHKIYWQSLNDIIKDRRHEIENMKFNISKFDNCKHRQ